MTQAGVIEISDIQNQFDELSIWDKKKFIANNLETIGLEPEDVIDTHNIAQNAQEAVKCFDTYDLLYEMYDEDIEDYITDENFYMSNKSVIKLLEHMVKNTVDPGKDYMQEIIDILEPWIKERCEIKITAH